MADGFSMKVLGLRKYRRRLARLRGATRRRIVRPAVSKALTPILKATRANVPTEHPVLSPEQLEKLRKSFGRKLKTYGNSGVIWGGIAPRKEGFEFHDPRTGKMIDPGHIVGLVEFGGVGVPAAAPMRRAFDSQRRVAEQILRRAIWAGIKREARRR